MAFITCAISGVRFECSYLKGIHIPHTRGYFHPIFALPRKQLYTLYSAHTKGELTSTDSYLLFIAFLHSSEKIDWKHPATLAPNDSRTTYLIENNLAQLIEVLEKTDAIQHPSFLQPKFSVTFDTCNLEPISNWIKAWRKNIKLFYSDRATLVTKDTLQKVENRLTRYICSGEDPETYSHVIAEWAAKAAVFPEDVTELWKKTIRSCFSISKMFNTPLVLLKEIKDYCECNIEVGSIHFHTLSAVLKEGIFKHTDYLGGSHLALGYTLLETPPASATARKLVESTLKNDAEVAAIAARAPSSYPLAEDYPSSLAFLKAKLAYSMVTHTSNNEEKTKND